MDILSRIKRLIVKRRYRFTAKATNEGVDMKFFGLTISSPDGGIDVGANDFNMVDSLELYEGNTLLGSVTVNSANATITPSGGQVTLAVNQERVLTVKAKFKDVSTPSAATSGGGMKVTLSHVEATGTSAGSSSVRGGSPATRSERAE